MSAMKQAYFITATGTDLGKTWLTAGLAGLLRQRGEAVCVVKPVMSGYDESRPWESDAGVLLKKVGAGDMKSPAGVTPDAIAAIAPWRFAAPLSPDRAAALEGKRIDFDELVAWCRDRIAATEGTLLIEGIGGVMVPLDEGHTVRDWIAALHVPVVLVAGSYLGSLSHTLTALAALREVGVVPVAVVVNESAGGDVRLADVAASLTPHLGDAVLVVMGRNDLAGMTRLADALA